MTPEMETALAAPRVLLSGLLHIAFPGHDLRLCDASAAIAFDGQVFTGSDAVFGAIESIDAIGEAAGDSFPAIDLVLLPPDGHDPAEVASPDMQGSAVRIWLAAIHPDTGATIADPELLFAGEIDVATHEAGLNDARVNYSMVSVFERFFAPDEGARLSDAFHQSIHPGELGFKNMTGTPVNRLWGPGDKPPAATIV